MKIDFGIFWDILFFVVSIQKWVFFIFITKTFLTFQNILNEVWVQCFHSTELLVKDEINICMMNERKLKQNNEAEWIETDLYVWKLHLLLIMLIKNRLWWNILKMVNERSYLANKRKIKKWPLQIYPTKQVTVNIYGSCRFSFLNIIN